MKRIRRGGGGEEYAKGRSRHADFRGAIDQENARKRGERAALPPKIPNGTTRSGLLPSSPFEIGRFFEPFFPTRHLWSPRLPSFLPLFDSRLVFASCVSPPFRGGTFVKEGLPPLFRERTPPLIFRDDRSVPAFLIVQQHRCFHEFSTKSFRSCETLFIGSFVRATVIFFFFLDTED